MAKLMDIDPSAGIPYESWRVKMDGCFKNTKIKGLTNMYIEKSVIIHGEITYDGEKRNWQNEWMHWKK